MADGWTDGWIDGWTDGWTNGRKKYFIQTIFFSNCWISQFSSCRQCEQTEETSTTRTGEAKSLTAGPVGPRGRERDVLLAGSGSVERHIAPTCLLSFVSGAEIHRSAPRLAQNSGGADIH